MGTAPGAINSNKKKKKKPLMLKKPGPSSNNGLVITQAISLTMC